MVTFVRSCFRLYDLPVVIQITSCCFRFVLVTHRKVKGQARPSLDLPADQQLEDLFDVDEVLRVGSEFVFPVDADRVVADQSAGGEGHVHVEGLDHVCFLVDTIHNLVDKRLCVLNRSDASDAHNLG